MPWRFSEDVEPYAQRVLPLLAPSPAEHTIALSVIDTVRAGHAWSDEPMLFGWLEDDGDVRGAVSRNPPYELLLAVVPEAETAGLVTALREAGAAVPGVNGAIETVERFAAAWTAGTGLRATTAFELRLFALGSLQPPDPPGRGRAAAAADLELAMTWFSAFEEELGLPVTESEPRARRQIEAGRLWLWEDDGGTMVAMAGRNAAAAGVARITAVYTPPEHRGRRYGGAVTAACAADALARDAQRVVLFTDLAAPAPNAVYQRIGFRPLSDHRVVRFDGAA